MIGSIQGADVDADAIADWGAHAHPNAWTTSGVLNVAFGRLFGSESKTTRTTARSLDAMALVATSHLKLQHSKLRLALKKQVVDGNSKIRLSSLYPIPGRLGHGHVHVDCFFFSTMICRIGHGFV